MPFFRATIRHGAPRPRYQVEDVQAGDLRDAMRRVLDRIGDDVAADADLVEIRLQSDPDDRDYTPG